MFRSSLSDLSRHQIILLEGYNLFGSMVDHHSYPLVSCLPGTSVIFLSHSAIVSESSLK
jgi:hypothetical protein